MKNVVFTRIDERLIHGQIMTKWIQFSGANTVVIVDDGTAKDSFLQMIMKSSVPAKIGLKVFSVDDAISYLTGADDSDKLFLLVKTPTTLTALVDAGIKLDAVNAGNMGARAGREVLFRGVSANDDEKAAFKKLINGGVRCYFRNIPSDPEEDVAKHL